MIRPHCFCNKRREVFSDPHLKVASNRKQKRFAKLVVDPAFERGLRLCREILS